MAFGLKGDAFETLETDNVGNDGGEEDRVGGDEEKAHSIRPGP